jgi:hypothetical protein
VLKTGDGIALTHAGNNVGRDNVRPGRHVHWQMVGSAGDGRVDRSGMHRFWSVRLFDVQMTALGA